MKTTRIKIKRKKKNVNNRQGPTELKIYVEYTIKLLPWKSIRQWRSTKKKLDASFQIYHSIALECLLKHEKTLGFQTP